MYREERKRRVKIGEITKISIPDVYTPTPVTLFNIVLKDKSDRHCE